MTSWYPHRARPLEGVFVREHAKAVSLSDEVVVLHCTEIDAHLTLPWQFEQETDDCLAEGIPTFRVRHRRSPVPKTSYPFGIWTVWQAFRRIVSTGFRPDVLHAHVYKAGVAAAAIGRSHRLPVITTEHYSGFARGVLNTAEVLKARFAFANSRLVTVVSHFQQRAIEQNGIRARFRVVPNVVDTAVFRYAGNASPHPGPRRLLAVGSLESVKGTDVLLQAMTILVQQRDDWHLDLVGGGPAQQDYQRRAGELGIGGRITFHGTKPKEDIAALMTQTDLFVLPSLIETFSVATAEALASGLPVVVTDCGGPAEFVGPDAGVVVPKGDPHGLSGGINYALDHLERYSKKGIAAYAQERFSPDVIGAQWHAIYADVTSELKRGPKRARRL